VELEGMQVVEFDESSTRSNVLGDSLDWEINPHLAKLCRKVAVQSYTFSPFGESPLNPAALLGVLRSGVIVSLVMLMHLGLHLLSKERIQKQFAIFLLTIVKIASEKFHHPKENPH
jgi:hypothetical protein